MGFQDFIGEREACTLAGVSAATLRRFAEAGYFTVESDSDGLRLFSRNELEALFGLAPRRVAPPHEGPGEEPRRATTVTPGPVAELTHGAGPAAGPASSAAVPFSASSAAVSSSASSAAVPFSASSAAVPSSAAVRQEMVSPTPGAPLANDNSLSHLTSFSHHTSFPHHNAPVLDTLDREVTRLRHLCELQEKLLDARDEELRALRSERDWLRTRIERQEEKNDRDQLLLLAETQTIRRLIAVTEERRSPIKLALEWLGFKQPQVTGGAGAPIEIAPSRGGSTSSPA